MTNDAFNAFAKTVREIKRDLGSIDASLEAQNTKISGLDTEKSLLKTLQDEMVQMVREIDKEVIHQMILNDPGSKECKNLQKQKHIQEIMDAANEYEL